MTVICGVDVVRMRDKSGSEAEDDALDAPRRDIRRPIPNEESWKRCE